jgi:FMN phosphatase YigB (HAD superfamily)
MNLRAVIFDIYTTILEVGPSPADAEALWQKLFADALVTPPPLRRTEFSVRTSQVVARQHAAAKLRGIPWPEILWPAVVSEVVPGLTRLSPHQQEDFIFRQMQIGRTLRLAAGAAECLRWLADQGCPLGIASNAQAYTGRELEAAFAGTGVSLAQFDRALCFWSFENGFSKPDPHAFRMLTARLEARGIRPAETLMVGDRLDNDIEPARAQGWKTWWLLPGKPADGRRGGNWTELRAWLA